MILQENYNLQALNSFHIKAYARYFSRVDSVEDLMSALGERKRRNLPLLVLGGGSNVLFTGDFDGLVLKINILGFDQVKENDDHIWIKAGAGEEWHGFVMKCISLGYGGVENLSLIPGTVGAAPMQNIGAYGTEIKETFESLEAVEIETGRIKNFGRDECEFGYRFSIFKGKAKGKYIITAVTLKLNKKPLANTAYDAVASTLNEWNIKSPTIKDVSDAVVYIRQSKLPDPGELGNAGSFFKNPVVRRQLYEKIKSIHHDAPGYLLDDNHYKLSAAWLIEKCGWKGRRFNDAGVHQKHALVLVNYGKATGGEIKELAGKIQESVWEAYSVRLEPEVNLV